jgi:hypothetical protein
MSKILDNPVPVIATSFCPASLLPHFKQPLSDISIPLSNKSIDTYITAATQKGFNSLLCKRGVIHPQLFYFKIILKDYLPLFDKVLA